MARATKLTIEGVPDLKRKFAQLQDAIAAEVLEHAVRDGAQIVETGIDQRVPRRTGRLARSISMVTVEKNRSRAVAGIGVNRDGWYWRLVEFGTRHSKARPFVRPPFDRSKKTVKAKIAEIVRAAVMKVAR